MPIDAQVKAERVGMAKLSAVQVESNCASGSKADLRDEAT